MSLIGVSSKVSNPLEPILDSMAEVEKEDLRVRVILVHPQDLVHLQAKDDYHPYAGNPSPRPEWDGSLVGTIWGMDVIMTPKVDPGAPEVLPTLGGVRGILLSLRESRDQFFKLQEKYKTPPPPDPIRLSALVNRARLKLIDLLGGSPKPPQG